MNCLFYNITDKVASYSAARYGMTPENVGKCMGIVPIRDLVENDIDGLVELIETGQREKLVEGLVKILFVHKAGLSFWEVDEAMRILEVNAPEVYMKLI